MPSRTQIVCLHEGKRGRSIDGLFINHLLRSLKPPWIRWEGSNIFRPIDCGGRTQLIERVPAEAKLIARAGADTTLMVWADLDHDMEDGEALKSKFRQACRTAGVGQAEFDAIVFVFAKDRLENWIEYLLEGETDESREGRRFNGPAAKEAAGVLADRCRKGPAAPPLPPSLEWSCANWRALVRRMR